MRRKTVPGVGRRSCRRPHLLCAGARPRLERVVGQNCCDVGSTHARKWTQQLLTDLTRQKAKRRKKQCDEEQNPENPIEPSLLGVLHPVIDDNRQKE
jgi:hypothetical protein